MRKLHLSILVICLALLLAAESFADTRFVSKYPCRDGKKTCLSSGERVIDGFKVHRDCWEWGYEKICDYPSKNDCALYEHCYLVATHECLLFDSNGNCVNRKYEFSCKSWQTEAKEDNEARVDLVEKDGDEGLVCNAVPCMDGNCVDKSYVTNGEMMDSISKLHAASAMKPDKDHNFNLFAGNSMHCSKKPVGYKNCCSKSLKGWGDPLGVKCSKDEIALSELRSKNLCVYAGKKTTGTKPVHVNKHYFCCFGNMLEKVVQVEGRKQLGKNFGSGGEPDCRGLTMQEIERLDFSKMDFSEFIDELMVKFTGTYNTPNPQERGDSIESHMNIQKYDGDENNPDNKYTGLNANNSKEGRE